MVGRDLSRLVIHVEANMASSRHGAKALTGQRTPKEEVILDYSWFDLVGNIGVLLMVVAYLLLQLEKLSSSAVSYLLLNAIGAVLVIISLTFRFNLSAFLMEAFWLLISLYGLTKPLFSRRTI
ncbi:MAG TPA: hypothetical protein VGW76_08965 [Pyrinomonadaceae bacterium]|nr:hypothetical protein [Pyrinomonadaceae bacterium]